MTVASFPATPDATFLNATGANSHLLYVEMGLNPEDPNEKSDLGNILNAELMFTKIRERAKSTELRDEWYRAHC